MPSVTGATVNLRAGPGTEYPIQGQVQRGYALQVIARNAASTWIQIEAPQGQVWIYAPLTSIAQGQIQSLPVGQYAPIPTSTPTPIREAAPAGNGGDSAFPSRLASLRVAPHSAQSTYDRDDWPHWADVDRDCQNTRAEVLIAESTAPVHFRDQRSCVVDSGSWIGPWSGERFTQASRLDIDHHVPLHNAHISGGAGWTRAQKAAYANDMDLPAALQATKNSLNRQKGARGPEAWRPPVRGAWCQYARDWIDVKFKYGLSVTGAEKAALQDMLRTCTGNAGGPPPAAPPPPPVRVPTATPAPQAPPVGLRYDPAGPDRDCGDFDTWQEANDFFMAAGGPDRDPHRLDRNKDGIPCESLR